VALTHVVDTSVISRLWHAAAEANDLAVLHYDADFDRIAKLTGQRTEWVVRAGSVD
jgi:hypothetical protein